MEKRNNIILIIIIIVLSLLVMGLGYVVLTNKQKTSCNCNTETEKTAENTENKNEGSDEEENEEMDEEEKENARLLSELVDEFPHKNDSKVTGDDIYKEFDLIDVERHPVKLTSKYNNYKIVIQFFDNSIDQNAVKIYDSNNNVVYKNDNVRSEITTDYFYDRCDINWHNVLPTISKGKLHILTYNNKNCYYDKSQDEYIPYLEYRQIDLSGNKIKETTVMSVKYEMDGAIPECKK